MLSGVVFASTSADDGVRSMKAVRWLELVELAPGEDVEDHESLATLD